MQTRKPQLDALTGVRFFAAFHVVVYHHAALLDPLVPAALPFLGHYLHTGYSGVNLFFVLSGFILAYTYCDPRRPPVVDPERFWVARFARIYPVYLLGLLLVAPLVVSHFAATNAEATAALKIGVSGAVAAGLFQAWIPPLAGIWNSPGWTLSVEAFFYALFPFLVPLLWPLSRRQALVAAGVAWALGLLPPLVSMLVLAPELPVAPGHGHMPVEPLAGFLRIAPIFRLHEFVFGICLARAFFPDPAAGARSARRFGAVALGAAASILLALALAPRIPRLLIEAGVLDPLYGALIVGLASGRSPLRSLLATPPMRILGEASYALYILHIPLRAWMERGLGAPVAELGARFFALYAPLAVALSVLAFYALEDPARRWIRSRAPAAIERLTRAVRP